MKMTKKLVFWNILFKIFQYLIFIVNIVFLYFLNFIGLLIISILMLILFAIIGYFRKKEDNRVNKALKEKNLSLEKKWEEKRGDIDFMAIFLNDLSNDNYNIESIENKINFLIKNDYIKRDEILPEIRKIIFDITENLFRDLMIFLDREGYQLNKFIRVKNEKKYLIWLLFEVLVFVIAVVILFNAYFGIHTIILHQFFYIFVFIFEDIKSKANKTFKKSYSRYIRNKRFINSHQKTINMFLDNSHIRELNNFIDLELNYILLNKRFEFYKTSFTPISEVLKRFEVIGLLGITFTFIMVLFQELLFTIPPIQLNELVIDLILIFLIILIIYYRIISPIRTEYKKSSLHTLHLDLEKALKSKYKHLDACLFLLNK